MKLQKRSIMLLVIFLLVMVFITVIGRQLILGDTLPQNIPTSPTAESISQHISDPSRPDGIQYEGSDYQLQNQRYFNNDEWLVATIVAIKPRVADPAVVVMKRYENKYEVVMGPGTVFAADDLTGIPNDVVNYLRETGMIANF